MKNVFILPTDAESNLFIDIDNGNKLTFTKNPIGGEYFMNQFIYITNYEELNILNNVKNKWFLSEYGFVIKADRIEDGYLHHTNGGSNYIHFYKEVLLTNDPSLIADGVQEISSSFLSSFASNPVDYVEVTKMLQVMHGVDWHDLPNQTEGRDREGIYQHIYKLNFPKKRNSK